MFVAAFSCNSKFLANQIFAFHFQCLDDQKVFPSSAHPPQATPVNRRPVCDQPENSSPAKNQYVGHRPAGQHEAHASPSSPAHHHHSRDCHQSHQDRIPPLGCDCDKLTLQLLFRTIFVATVTLNSKNFTLFCTTPQVTPYTRRQLSAPPKQKVKQLIPLRKKDQLRR